MKDNIPVEGVVELFSSSNISVDEEGLVSLNDVYRIAIERGLDGGKLDPRRWTEKPRAIKSGTSGKISLTERDGYQFVEFIAKKYGKSRSDVYKTKRGKGGGTFAHKDIALEYAMYLGGNVIKSAIIERIGEIDQILKAFENFHVDEEIVDAMKQTYNVNKLYVYAIKEDSTGNIKIGISANPRRRLEQLQTGNSSALTLVAVKEAVNGYADEAKLHLTNAAYHVRGEWFSGQASIN